MVDTFYSLDDLIATVLKNQDRYDLISFDVFDTLLIRRVHDPDHIKGSVCRFVSNLANRQEITIHPDHVLRIRGRIEAKHRKRNGLIHPDHEAIYPQFIGEMVEEIFGPQPNSVILDQILDYELTLESRLLIARRAWIDLLTHLRDRGKTLIALSDMYLPGDAIQQLLHQAGLGAYFQSVHSSADSCRAKASGQGFYRLVERHGYSPRRWLHIGDHPFSDGLRPASLGITAYCLRDAEEKKRKAVLQRYFLASQRKSFWYGRYLLQIALPLEAEAQQLTGGEQLYREGYCFFGPLLAGFIAHLERTSREQSIPVLYFLSREGHLFEQIWSRMAPILAEGGPLPEVRYLHVSRKALAAASCGAVGLSPDLAMIAFLPPGNRDFQDLCRVADLDPEPLEPFLRAHGLKLHDDLSANYPGHTPEIANRFRDLLDDQDFQAQVREQKSDAHQGFIRYIQSQGLLDFQHVGLVDIGWLGTIQRLFDLCIAPLKKRPTLHGLLFAATFKIPFPEHSESRLSGWIHDGRRQDVFASMVQYYLELFEEVCRPPEPGLLSYSQQVDSCLIFRHKDDPVFQMEYEQSLHIAPLQQGILDAAGPLAIALILSGHDANRMKPWLTHTIVAKFGFPKTREVALLRHRHHVNDIDSNRSPTERNHTPAQRLWEESERSLMWRPFLRTWYALKHIALNLIHLS